MAPSAAGSIATANLWHRTSILIPRPPGTNRQRRRSDGITNHNNKLRLRRPPSPPSNVKDQSAMEEEQQLGTSQTCQVLSLQTTEMHRPPRKRNRTRSTVPPRLPLAMATAAEEQEASSGRGRTTRRQSESFYDLVFCSLMAFIMIERIAWHRSLRRMCTDLESHLTSAAPPFFHRRGLAHTSALLRASLLRLYATHPNPNSCLLHTHSHENSPDAGSPHLAHATVPGAGAKGACQLCHADSDRGGGVIVESRCR